MKALLTCLTVILTAVFSMAAVAEQYVIWAGGVSQEERDAAPNEGIKLEFFEEGGPYLANIQVQIKDDTGTNVVNTVCPGPWLIVDLPEGKYKVIATRANGEEEIVNIDTGDNTKTYGFMFSAI